MNIMKMSLKNRAICLSLLVFSLFIGLFFSHRHISNKMANILEEESLRYEQQMETGKRLFSDLDIDKTFEQYCQKTEELYGGEESVQKALTEQKRLLRSENGASSDKMYLKSFGRIQEEIIRLKGNRIRVGFDEYRTESIWLLVIALVILGFSTFMVFRSIRRWISYKKELGRFIQELSVGKLPDPLRMTGDDFRSLFRYGNQLRTNMQRSTEFASAIGMQSDGADFAPTGKDDLLGNALLTTHHQLMKVARKDQQANWVNEGMNKLIELTRESKEDVQAYCDLALGHLVRYSKSNQGVMYSFSEDEEMVIEACYAYNRKKYIKARFQKGEGLVGQLIYEKETIHLREIPEDYMQITSGLGDAKPRTVILVPLLFNDQLVGAFELASFEEFGEKELRLFEHVADHLASDFSSIRTAVLTQKLLKESQMQTENLKSQEEELRQNMEELQATHEELERIKEEERKKTEALLNKAEESSNLVSNILDELPIGIFVKDKDLNMFLVNKYITDKHDCKKEDMLGLSDREFIAHDPELAHQLSSEEYSIIDSGKGTCAVHVDEVFAEVHGKEVILETHKVPFYINSEKGTGILGFQLNRTDRKHAEQTIKELQEKLKKYESELEE